MRSRNRVGGSVKGRSVRRHRALASASKDLGFPKERREPWKGFSTERPRDVARLLGLW